MTLINFAGFNFAEIKPVGYTLGPVYEMAVRIAGHKPEPVFAFPEKQYPCVHAVFRDVDVYPYWHRYCVQCRTLIDCL